MLAKAWSRSAFETPRTWSNRARAFLTCEASVSGSFRCFGNAYTLSGRSLRSVSSPCFVCGFQVVLFVIFAVLLCRSGCWEVEAYDLLSWAIACPAGQVRRRGLGELTFEIEKADSPPRH